jgi:hypothetical protein
MKIKPKLSDDKISELKYNLKALWDINRVSKNSIVENIKEFIEFMKTS